MIRIDTSRNSAQMIKIMPFGDRAVLHLEHVSMCPVVLAINSEYPVPIDVKGTLPEPASSRFINDVLYWREPALVPCNELVGITLPKPLSGDVSGGGVSSFTASTLAISEGYCGIVGMHRDVLSSGVATRTAPSVSGQSIAIVA